MAVTPKTITSGGLLGPDPEIVEGMGITITADAVLEVTLSADGITVEIDDE